MRSVIALVFVAVILASCFSRNPYRIENFSYNQGGVNHSVPVVIPKGYNKKWTTIDEAGNTILSYTWRNGPLLYMAHMADTSFDMQPIYMPENMPRISHHNGSLIYKGIDEDLLFYREVRQKNYRMGYRWVNRDEEFKFDSATNYLVVWPLEPSK
jgi:hypothetical protein